MKEQNTNLTNQRREAETAFTSPILKQSFCEKETTEQAKP
jgi:hypothetical protein